MLEEDQPHGSSTTIETIARTVQGVFEQCEQSGGPKPTHLWVQCDNAASENKNQLLIRFLGTLIDKSIFRSCVISFMRVGHTHEDIGQPLRSNLQQSQELCVFMI